MEGVNRMAPFGIGNPRPVLWTTGAQLADGPRRLKERHLSMSLRHDGVPLRAVFWRAAERAADIWRRAAAPGRGIFGRAEHLQWHASLELSLADVRPSSAGEP